MAHVTVSQFAQANAFMRGNRIAFRPRIARRLPAHIRDPIRRPQVWSGVAMAIKGKNPS